MIRNERNGKVVVCMNRKTLVQYLAWEYGPAAANKMLRGKLGSGKLQPQKVIVETWRGFTFTGWTVGVVSLPLCGRPSAKDWRNAQNRVVQGAAYINGKRRAPRFSHDVRIVDVSQITSA